MLWRFKGFGNRKQWVQWFGVSRGLAFEGVWRLKGFGNRKQWLQCFGVSRGLATASSGFNGLAFQGVWRLKGFGVFVGFKSLSFKSQPCSRCARNESCR